MSDCILHDLERDAWRDARDAQDFGGYRRVASAIVDTDRLPSRSELAEAGDERVGEGDRC